MRNGFQIIAVLLVLSSQAVGADPAGIEFFETKIRPVLIKHCYECHSEKATSLKGGLLVDSAAGLLAGGDSGPSIVKEKSGESLLLQSLRYETYEMPPAGKLPDEVIADFERWIAMGAPDPRTGSVDPSTIRKEIDLTSARQFWSFLPVESHVIPEVTAASWPRNWIDRFVLSRLESEQLAPQPDADRATLLRRISFDLTGLPPTLADQERFLETKEADAIEKYVDSLLASPQYGVHWGRHWLDVARYADSNGGDFNATFHEAWRYRNYIINSFNDDRSFQDLIIEQIAGDLMPSQSEEQRVNQLIATGFLMLGTKMLSERDKEKLRMDVVDEQISAVGSAFLGMTLGCARCHDHKFDPIPTKDYYALAGIFRSTQVLDGEIQQYVSNWVRQPLPIAPEHAAALAEHEKKVNALKQEIKKAESQLKKLDSTGERAAALRLGVVVDDKNAEQIGTWKSSTFSKDFIGENYLHDDKMDKGQKKVIFRTKLPKEGEYEVRLAFFGRPDLATNVPVTILHADGEAKVAVDQSQVPPISKLFKPIGRWRFTPDRNAEVTIETTGTVGYVFADAVQFIPIEELNQKPDEKQPQVAEQTGAKKRLDELKNQQKELAKNGPPPAPVALAVKDATERGDCNVCIRGETRMLGPKVPRGFLSVMNFHDPIEISEDESGRLELAKWIADSRNPLTARVYVNRVWHHLMGAGLVRSVDNFGHLGDQPTHLELLDQLAVEFIAHGWSTKWLVRQIVLSRTYQQSAEYDAVKWERDPENKLLWRANLKRISAESIRDSILAAGEQLDLTAIESSVAGLGTLVTVNVATDQGVAIQESKRRTAYQPVLRSELASVLRVFDFADPDFSTGERAKTNVPAQALWMLNGDFVTEQSAVIVNHSFKTPYSTVGERVERISMQVLGRPPTSDEARISQTYLDSKLLEVEDEADEKAVWQEFVHALIASTSFRILD
ncbi:DUF1553 domain-containing protein [Planctomicrobium sp. SH527]|uniref:DUF1553 domain-containing protein n=1 Tax=Planctomicrobium sp. SH527 TaxID=3448123 RepID=UPI003F5B316D